MPNVTPLPRLRRVARASFFTVLGIALLVGAVDSAIGWLVPVALVGGGLIAGLLIARRSRHRDSTFSPDSFERGDMGADVMNFSRVRVAGIGGVGLLLVALAAAFQFQLIAAVLTAGAIGGLITGVAMILYRRRHARGSSGTMNPGTGSILFAENPADAARLATRRQESGGSDFRLAVPSAALSRTV